MSLSRRASRTAPGSFLTPGTSSFTDFLSLQAPELLPGRRRQPAGRACQTRPHTARRSSRRPIPMAWSWPATAASTMGNIIAQRDVEKVFPADEYSCIGIAGAAGIAVEMVRLFQLELEHYEKIEGMVLSLDGKANRLSHMIRGNLAAGHAGPGRAAAVCGFRPRPGRPAGSSPTTSPGAAPRSTCTTRWGPVRCSLAAR